MTFSLSHSTGVTGQEESGDDAPHRRESWWVYLNLEVIPPSSGGYEWNEMEIIDRLLSAIRNLWIKIVCKFQWVIGCQGNEDVQFSVVEWVEKTLNRRDFTRI